MMASNKKSMSPEQLGHLVQLIRDGIDLASKACNSFLESGHSNLKESDQGEPVEILPHLYLGSSYHASCKRTLDKLGITALLNVSRGCPNYFEDSYEYKCIPVEDSSSEEISVWFDEAIDFIDTVKKSNGKVLVHCRAGISRSATICMAYLMVTKRLRMEAAYEYVKSRRKVISPNFNFMGQLLSFEAKLFAAKDFFSLEECVNSSSVLASL